MLSRTISTLFIAAVVVGLASSVALAHEGTHDGKVVKAGGGKLTLKMADQKGTDHQRTMDVATSATITVDEKPGKLEDLKEGYHVKVTNDAKHVITKIEAHSKEK